MLRLQTAPGNDSGAWPAGFSRNRQTARIKTERSTLGQSAREQLMG